MSRKLRVLFVEDNPSDVTFIVRALNQGGFEPVYEVVDDGDSLRHALAAAPWDIIISDHSMPSFDAPEALHIVRESGQDVPFIVVSGHIGEETAVACMKAGANDWVSKDHPARLVPAIERELRDAEQRRQRERAETTLRMREEQYRLLVENAADLIALIDDQGHVAFQSPSVTRALGYAEGELLGRPILEIVHPEDAPRVSEMMGEALRGGRRVNVDQVRLRHRDGSWRTFEGSGSGFFGEDGRPRLVTAARDITERVRLHQQLVQSQKMEAVGRLAGGVAHDFNNLLTVILGYGNLLLDQLSENPPLLQEVDEIKRAATRAASLTQQLLAFSRKQLLSARVVDLNADLDGLSSMLQHVVGENVALELRLQPGLGHVRVDPGQIEQVIMNLAINARDAMGERGTLTVSTRNVELDEARALARGVSPGRYVRIEVRDTGHGMDAATLGRLFEPFFTTKEPGKGTGLGLSTAYGIVRQSGGSIYAESAPGLGSAFRILLPRVDEPVTPEAEPAVPAPTRGSETVLLVEDEPLVRSLVNDILRKGGYHVIETSRGEEAVLAARRHAGPIDALVTDVVMPGISGIDAAQLIGETRPDMRVMYLSGYTDERVLRHGPLAPGHAFLQKPFTPDALLLTLRELLDRAPAPAHAHHR
ncbi:MAG TPA: response regulator [Candidatus Eisenbacteria bacterium]|nr:response regulator [Candidatus Eisenbacteria bacterium]